MSTEVLLGGRYALRGVLGRGGMAVVHDGWDTRLGRAVAVKLLHPGLADDPENRRRFEHEARSAAALSHPNIVAVYDRGEHDGTPFIVMERLPGNTLAELIARGPLPPAQVRTILAEVLAALVAAHQAGILHRDVKPGNILFTSSGTVKVADFGIAKTTDTNHTVAGQIVGTVAYLSRERLSGQPATPSDDLYAVGAVGYEALTGRRAFPQDTLGSLSHAIMTQRPPALAALRPDVDPMLTGAIERAMAPTAQARFGSAVELHAALFGHRPSLTGGPRPATVLMTSPLPPLPAPAGVPAARPMSRARRLVLLAAGLAAVLITAAAFLLDSWAHPTPTPTEPTTATTPASTVAPSSTATSSLPETPIPPTQPADPPRKHGRGHERLR